MPIPIFLKSISSLIPIPILIFLAFLGTIVKDGFKEFTTAKEIGTFCFCISFNAPSDEFSPKVAEETYLRKGYLINLGFSKVFYMEGTYDFNKTFSLISAVTFGENSSDGALKDIQKQKVPISFAVVNSLNPSFTIVPKKARNISIGIGLREDILFKNIGIGISGIVGYQHINRPEFYLADNSLTKYNSTEKIVYAWSQAQTASGLFFKPSFDITYWLNSRIAIFTVIDYSFGPKFKGQQTNWNATNIDGDAYFSVEEIRRGYLSTKTFDNPINTLSAGVGLKYIIKHQD